MVLVLRVVLLVVAALCGAPSVLAGELAYEPVRPSWSAEEVERAASGTMTALTMRAEQGGQFGCSRRCERLECVFTHLVTEARKQNRLTERLAWSLTVVGLADVDTMALPGGQIVIFEAFLDQRAATDETLTFILAHEIAHSILEHERQALSFARMLLPRDLPRSVRDMHTEMEFNFALLRKMEPVLQQGEFEADERGFLLASTAGYAPRLQLEFIAWEAAHATASKGMVATHPAAALGLEKLRERLPLARRLLPPGAD